MSNSETRGREVIGAATKSSSAESRRTTAGRTLPPGAWWKSIRIRTTSPGRRVMDQRLIYRVIGGVSRLELPSTGRAPSGIVRGDAPLEDHLNLFPWRNLRCNLRRNCDLTVRRELAPEVGGFQSLALTHPMISRTGNRRALRSEERRVGK